MENLIVEYWWSLLVSASYYRFNSFSLLCRVLCTRSVWRPVMMEGTVQRCSLTIQISWGTGVWQLKTHCIEIGAIFVIVVWKIDQFCAVVHLINSITLKIYLWWTYWWTVFLQMQKKLSAWQDLIKKNSDKVATFLLIPLHLLFKCNQLFNALALFLNSSYFRTEISISFCMIIIML